MAESMYPPINKRILTAIENCKEAIVIGHKNPDGDCIFSSLAMKKILEKLGKRVHLLSMGPFKNQDTKCYESLFSSTLPEGLVEKKPLVIVVDCSTADRPGELFSSLLDLEIVVFDHHSSGVSFTSPELEYIVPASVSTTLIINEARKALGVELDQELATYLYSGFATDSGFYHFINEKVGGETLRKVAEFVDAGVSPYIIYDSLHDGKKLEYCKALGLLLERTTSLCDGKLLYSYLRKEEETEGSPSDALYAQLLQVEGVKLVLLFKEKEGKVEIGVRSKNLSSIDAGDFASTFSGGGHKYAAGIGINTTLEDAMNKVLEAAKKLF